MLSEVFSCLILFAEDDVDGLGHVSQLSSVPRSRIVGEGVAQLGDDGGLEFGGRNDFDGAAV